ATSLYWPGVRLPGLVNAKLPYLRARSRPSTLLLLTLPRRRCGCNTACRTSASPRIHPSQFTVTTTGPSQSPRTQRSTNAQNTWL
ncbi:hypothetical protein FRC07_013433, partial [Ceratobasidium sp. 392]